VLAFKFNTTSQKLINYRLLKERLTLCKNKKALEQQTKAKTCSFMSMHAVHSSSVLVHTHKVQQLLKLHSAFSFASQFCIAQLQQNTVFRQTLAAMQFFENAA
jgi:hypothetical protein